MRVSSEGNGGEDEEEGQYGQREPNPCPLPEEAGLSPRQERRGSPARAAPVPPALPGPSCRRSPAVTARGSLRTAPSQTRVFGSNREKECFKKMY